MRILIVGELSGVSKSLKDGFLNLGCDCHILSVGDGYKKINSDNYLKFFINLLTNRKKVYDYTIFLTPFCAKLLIPSRLINEQLLQRSKKSLYIACGSDSKWWHNNSLKFLNRRAQYWNYRDLNNLPRYAQSNYLAYNNEFTRFVDKVYTFQMDYKILYENNDNHYHLPYGLPITIDKTYSPNNQKRKYNYYHGVTRPNMKGTPFIVEHLKKKEKVLITEKISFDKFVDNLKNTYVYFDQVFSIEPGIAAYVALQYSPIIFSANLKLDHRLTESPIIDFQESAETKKVDFDKLNISQSIQNNKEYLNKWHNPSNIVSFILNDN